MPGVVGIDDEFVIFGFNGNFFNSFWAAIFWSIIPTNEKVCVPEPDGSASNSSKSAIGINDLDL